MTIASPVATRTGPRSSSMTHGSVDTSVDTLSRSAIIASCSGAGIAPQTLATRSAASRRLSGGSMTSGSPRDFARPRAMTDPKTASRCTPSSMATPPAGLMLRVMHVAGRSVAGAVEGRTMIPNADRSARACRGGSGLPMDRRACLRTRSAASRSTAANSDCGGTSSSHSWFFRYAARNENASTAFSGV